MQVRGGWGQGQGQEQRGQAGARGAALDAQHGVQLGEGWVRGVWEGAGAGRGAGAGGTPGPPGPGCFGRLAASDRQALGTCGAR